MSLEGQRPISPEALGAAPLSDKLYQIVGTAPALLTKPSGAQVLYLVAEKGVWRMRVGDRLSDMPADPYPTASVTNGSGGFLLRSVGDFMGPMAIPAPNKLTLKGYSADATLTYYWL